MQTFWLEVKDDAAHSSSGGWQAREGEELEATTTMSGTTRSSAEPSDSKTRRLIDWQVDVLMRFLKQVVARRNAIKNLSSDVPGIKEQDLEWKPEYGKICLDEVKEIILLPEFDAYAARNQEDPYSIELGKGVYYQLYTFISSIAQLYRKNHFHSFEHACHVTMSVTKLLARIVAPCLDAMKEGSDSNNSDEQLKTTMESSMHDHTYGITSDPLTQFSLVFSALIHDVDHTGVPNTTLIKENMALASAYRDKSVAEQNSVDLSWNLLQTRQFNDLRSCIYSTEAEFDRFRQLVVQVSSLKSSMCAGILGELLNKMAFYTGRACN